MGENAQTMYTMFYENFKETLILILMHVSFYTDFEPNTA